MSTKTNLIIDFLIMAAFLVAYEEKLTQVAIHEWLSIALFLGIVIHLASHWQWVLQVTTRFFKQFFQKSRANYVLNVLLFVCFIVVMLSGILISREVMPFLGVQMGNDMTWKRLHTISADGVIIILGLHFAMHWDWIWTSLKKYVFSPIGRLFKRNKLATQAVAQSAPSPAPRAAAPPLAGSKPPAKKQ